MTAVSSPASPLPPVGPVLLPLVLALLLSPNARIWRVKLIAGTIVNTTLQFYKDSFRVRLTDTVCRN